MTNDESRYELFALTDGEDASVRRVLGRYRTYEAALRARDADVLRQLAATGGWYMTIEHVIVGPGLCGPQTSIGTRLHSGSHLARDGDRRRPTCTTPPTGCGSCVGERGKGEEPAVIVLFGTVGPATRTSRPDPSPSRQSSVHRHPSPPLVSARTAVRSQHPTGSRLSATPPRSSST
jgi:hypothetical protein